MINVDSYVAENKGVGCKKGTSLLLQCNDNNTTTATQIYATHNKPSVSPSKARTANTLTSKC